VFTAWQLRDKVRSCEIRKTLNAEPLVFRKRDLSDGSSVTWPECPKKHWRGESCLLNSRESSTEVVQGTGDVITSPTLLVPVLGWSQQNYVRLLKTVRCFEASRTDASQPSPEEVWVRKWMWKWTNARYSNFAGCWQKFCLQNVNFKQKIHVQSAPASKSVKKREPLRV